MHRCVFASLPCEASSRVGWAQLTMHPVARALPAQRQHGRRFGPSAEVVRKSNPSSCRDHHRRYSARRQGPVFRTDITRGARAKISVDVVEVFNHVSVATVSGHPAGGVAIEDHPDKHLAALQGGIIDDRRRRHSRVVFTMAACAVDHPQHAPCIGDARIALQLAGPVHDTVRSDRRHAGGHR